MLFRTELGAGLIKIRHDKCWRDLTCLFYHHETQPLPNALSPLFHRLPKITLKAGVVFSHFVQLIAPFGLDRFSRFQQVNEMGATAASH